MGYVMTVLGPISPEKLGFTLPHEHIFVDLTTFPGGLSVGGMDAIIDAVRHTEIMCQELEAFQAAGGKSFVDVTPRNTGGDIRAVKKMAETTGLNIIAGCAWYRESFMDHDIYYRPTNELAEELICEIEHGRDGTDIRPGIIGEIGAEYTHYHLSAKEERCLRAVAKAQQRTGLAVTTHLPQKGIAVEALDILGDHGVPPDRVVIGHCSFFLNLDYHRALIKRGAYLQFDTFGMAKYMPEEPDVVNHVAELVRWGHADRILLSHDVCWRSHLKRYGGHGFDYVPTEIIPRLKAKGVDDEAIHLITVENPKRVLTIQ